MNSLLPYLVTGLVTGSLYSMAGLGLVLTYRTSGVLNFGHGAIAAGAAFLFYTLHDEHGWPWPLAVAVTLALFGLVAGPVLEVITRSLVGAPAAAGVITTLGIFLAVDGFLLVHYGDIPKQASQFLPTDGVEVSGVLISYAQMISAGVALVGAVGLYRFLKSSRLGKSMRAVVDNPSLMALTGQNPVRVRRAAWMIGSAFAAGSGILLAPVLGLDATLLTFLVVQAFGGCAVGLFQNLPMTYVGGLVVGVLAALATNYFTDFPLNQIPPAVPFIVLIALLLVVPVRKLPGTKATVRSLVSTAAPFSRRTSALLAGGGFVAMLFVPAVVGTHLPTWIGAMSSVLIFGSLALLIWTSGQMSLCQVSFAALGGTTMAHLCEAGVPWLIALLLAGLLTVPVGAVIAIPAIRFSGIYLALVTLGFGILMQYVLYPTFLMFGKDLSVTARRPHLGPISADTSDKWQYYVALFVAAGGIALLVGINRSRFGRLLRGLAESPTMLNTLGLQVNVTRLILFCIAAFVAGVGGALMASQFTLSSTSFQPVQSLLAVALLGVCGIFGTRLVLTTILAALLMSVLPGYASSFDTDHQLLFFGVLAIAAGLVVANRATLTSALQRLAGARSDRRRHSPVSGRAATANRVARWSPPRSVPLPTGTGQPRRPRPPAAAEPSAALDDTVVMSK